jgi:Xaa-Pro aminopeptidase
MRISQQEYATRRKKITEKLPVGSVAVLCAKAETFRNADVQYPFRQASYFYYLTGFVEPQSVLVLAKDRNGNCESIFFCRARDPQAEVWNGKRVGPEMAKEQLLVDRTYSIDFLDHTIVELLKDKTQIKIPLILLLF